MSPAVAVRLGKLFGDGAGVWVRTQAAYDTWNAEREEDVSKIPTSPKRRRARYRKFDAVVLLTLQTDRATLEAMAKTPGRASRTQHGG